MESELLLMQLAHQRSSVQPLKLNVETSVEARRLISIKSYSYFNTVLFELEESFAVYCEMCMQWK